MAYVIATMPKEENPKISDDQPQQQLPSDPSCNNASETGKQQPLPTTGSDSSHKDGDDSKTSDAGATAGSTAAKDSNSNKEDEPVSSVQKKIRRAERFGLPVQLSEEEKRNSRAERFGIGSAMHGSDALKNSEVQKRKARAERFGIVQSVPAAEEAKKKARLDRFGAAPKIDSLEEDKKKARAIRFSQPPSSSLSLNGKENKIEMKTAIAGEAGGGT